MERNKLMYVYLILTIFFWSLVPSFSKLALQELNVLQLLFYTSILGAITLSIISICTGKFLVKKYSLYDYSIMFLMGFIGIFLFFIFRFMSFELAPAGQANAITYLYPIFIVLFSIILFKLKVDIKVFLGIIISFFGAVLIFTNGIFNFQPEFFAGYMFALIAGLIFAGFSVFGNQLKFDKLYNITIFYITSTILIIPITFILTDIVIPTNIITIVAVLILGVILNALAFVLWIEVLKGQMDINKISNAVYAVPVLALVWTYFLNSESITLPLIIGILLIFLGIFMQTRRRKIEKINGSSPCFLE